MQAFALLFIVISENAWQKGIYFYNIQTQKVK